MFILMKRDNTILEFLHIFQAQLDVLTVNGSKRIFLQLKL